MGSHVGGSLGRFVGGFSAMSYYLHSKSVFDALSFLNGDASFALRANVAAIASGRSRDRLRRCAMCRCRTAC